MKIFVIHYRKLIERKEYIIKQFLKNNITDYEFIDIDRDELNNYNTSFFGNIITNPGKAVFLSHMKAYIEIAEKYENALILEDDAILCDDFINKLNKYLTQLPQDYDMLFIGGSFDYHIENDKIFPDKYIYDKSLYNITNNCEGVTRCCDSYMVSKKCAFTLINYIINTKYYINSHIDIYLNEVAKNIILKIYWAEPTIVIQGSFNVNENENYNESLNKIFKKSY